MKRLLPIALLIGIISPILGYGSSDEELYRQMTFRVRQKGNFKVPMPSNGDLIFNYEFKPSTPLWELPETVDFSLDANKKKFYRHFWDKIFFEDGSHLVVGGEKVPLTCIFLSGQDNRFSKDTPLIPDFILKVYLVANDFTCTGPINPGWPSNGGKKEMWDTYVYYEIRDPTIMLPTEVKIRYRWVEFPAVVVDEGSGQ